tara:strand:+ start:6276 stop:6593 length:318 start_codon:yes stop_codon:yes gene_type:complete
MDKDYVVVTCVSSFRVRYVLHKDDLQKLNPDQPCDPVEWARDTVICEQCDAFSQDYIDEYIVNTATINEEEMIDLFDKKHESCKDYPRDKKVDMVRKIYAPLELP